MSTRCQVQVVDNDEKITLYHHSDGYVSNMLPLFGKAYKNMKNFILNKWEKKEYFVWQLDRAGYVASFLCYTDPRGFQPEEGHNLHGDIEYYYKLYCIKPKWEVEIYVSYGKKGFWDDAVIENMTLLNKRMPLSYYLTEKGKLRKDIEIELEKRVENLLSVEV
jgi:hypothetical protein